MLTRQIGETNWQRKKKEFFVPAWLPSTFSDILWGYTRILTTLGLLLLRKLLTLTRLEAGEGSAMNNIMNLVNRILDAIQNSAQARRLLGFSVIALAVLYWLTRRSSRSRRPNQGGRQSDDVQPDPPTITLSPGFHRVPVQQKVSLITNDSIFDSWYIKCETHQC